MSDPFSYPSEPHIRRHGPRGYSSYEGYRPWLRDEFCFRCVYCLRREKWGRGLGAFALDHFLPVARRPARKTDYDNLVYACSSCNIAKSDRVTPDPLTVLTSENVAVAADGTIHARTPEAAKLIELLGLDSDQTTEFRMLWLGIISLAQRFDPELHERLMSFPDDLPELDRLRPPAGNIRPAGVHQSWGHRKRAGALPPTY